MVPFKAEEVLPGTLDDPCLRLTIKHLLGNPKLKEEIAKSHEPDEEEEEGSSTILAEDVNEGRGQDLKAEEEENVGEHVEDHVEDQAEGDNLKRDHEKEATIKVEGEEDMQIIPFNSNSSPDFNSPDDVSNSLLL